MVFRRIKRASTGWSTLPLLSGITGGVWVKRTGVWVEMELRDITAATDGHASIVNVLAGYRPPILSSNSTRSGIVSTDAGATRTASYYQGYMRILSAVAGQPYSGRLIWSTDEAMPGGA